MFTWKRELIAFFRKWSPTNKVLKGVVIIRSLAWEITPSSSFNFLSLWRCLRAKYLARKIPVCSEEQSVSESSRNYFNANTIIIVGHNEATSVHHEILCTIMRWYRDHAFQEVISNERNVTYSLCCPNNILAIKKQCGGKSCPGRYITEQLIQLFWVPPSKEIVFPTPKVELRRDFTYWIQPTKNSIMVIVGSEKYELFFLKTLFMLF